MNRNYTKLLLTAVLMMCCMTMNAQTTFEVDGIKYSVTGDNTVEVVAKDSKYSGDIVIPATVTNPNNSTPYNVTSIGNSSFYDCTNLTSVAIPEGVTSIGVSAFRFCSNLTSVTIPEGVTSIGASAFQFCRYLTSVTIPEGVTSIGDNAFNNCFSLTSITIPSGVTSIGDNAFSETGWYKNQEDGLLYLCNYLVGVKGSITTVTDIVIKDGTTTIADRAIGNDNKVVSITIPKSVTSIGEWAFPVELNSITVDSENSVYDSRNNCNAIIETATNTLIAGCKKTIIPSDVTSIGNDAFRGCIELTSVTIPSGVTNIGDYAFLNCGLTEIYVLATTPPTLGSYAFNGVKKDILVLVPDVETYTGWGEFTNLIKNVDLTTAKKEAIADLQTFINEEKIANAPMEEYESRINAATDIKDILSIVNNIKAEISNYTKFTLGEWKYLLDKNDGEYTIVGDKLTFTDKDLYQSDYDFTVDGSITYSRTFTATGVWQAWFVPFNVPIDKMNQAGMEVAEIAGVLMDEKKQPYIAFAKMTDDDAIVKANTPYVVKATESSVSMTLTDPDMCIRKSTGAELEAQRLTVQSSYNTFTFGGNYQPTNGYANQWYALNTSGVFQKMGEDVNLAPQRFWMTIDTRKDTPYYTEEFATAKAFVNMTILGDDETTGIEGFTPTLSERNGTIYNLQGQRVTSIQKGQVYIVNGKKFFAR